MYKQIVVAIDLENSENNKRMIALATILANESGGDINLLHIVPAAPAIVSQFLDEDYEKMAADEIDKDLAKMAKGIPLTRGSVTSEVRFGTVYQEIIAAAGKKAADLIVIGASKQTVTDYLLGTNAARVVRHASCSVSVVR